MPGAAGNASAPQLTAAQAARLRKAFTLYDRDGSGKLAAATVKDVLRAADTDLAGDAGLDGAMWDEEAEGDDVQDPLEADGGGGAGGAVRPRASGMSLSAEQGDDDLFEVGIRLVDASAQAAFTFDELRCLLGSMSERQVQIGRHYVALSLVEVSSGNLRSGKCASNARFALSAQSA